jgi:hypothetical protein
MLKRGSKTFMFVGSLLTLFAVGKKSLNRKFFIQDVTSNFGVPLLGSATTAQQ